MIDILNYLPSDLKEKAIDLNKIDIPSYAWEIKSALEVVEQLDKAKELIILGGDLYAQKDGHVEETYENWFYEPLGDESDHPRSIMKARDYLQSKTSNSTILVDFVVAKADITCHNREPIMLKRKPTANELAILRKLLEPSFKGKREILAQLKSIRVSSTNDPDNYGSVYLHPMNDAVAPINLRIPVEGIVDDADGTPVAVLLHVIDGYLNELEVVKLNGTPLLQEINAQALQVKVNK